MLLYSVYLLVLSSNLQQEAFFEYHNTLYMYIRKIGYVLATILRYIVL